MASAEEEPLEELVERFFEEGRTDIEGYVRRHPARADELRRALEAMHALERAAGVFSEVDDESSGRGGKDEDLPCQPVAAGESPAKPDGPIHSVLGADESQDFVAQVLARLESPEPSQARYEFEGEVARGGQGAVLAVWDERLRRRLAMKVTLARTSAGSDRSEALSLGRFLEEAQVTAQLDHPGIVPVHDLGLDAERRVYFTMKLVKGRDLRAIFELVRRGEEGWTRTRALNVLLKVCEAMAYAHSKGVIHRDLKPANVMVGRFGEVYVMDWGLARVLASTDRKDIRIRPGPASELSSPRHDASDELDSPLVTMDGDVVGTPAYMPPEQARGELDAVGPHSDVYAVGAMLYQLLTGEMPYVTSGARLSNRAVWALVQRGPPEPVETLARGIPAELVVICEKAMAREVAARYRDMSELADDLRAYLEHRVVSAYETGPIAELRKWVERNKSLAASMAVGALALVAGLVASLVLKTESDANAARASAERGNVMRLSAFQELAELEQLADELWPPWPERAQAYRDWMRRAKKLVSGLEPDPGGHDIGHRARLAELEARALPYADEDREADRRSHPRFPELGRLQARIAALEKADAVRTGKARLDEFELDESVQSLDASSLNELAWARVDPARSEWDELPGALALARAATARNVSNASDRANFLDTLAWALVINGLDDGALAASDRALQEAPDDRKAEFRTYLDRVREEIEAARSGTTLAHTTEEVLALESELARRLTWRFANEEDRWWHSQLVDLIRKIEGLADPASGLIDGISSAHGWGVARRLAWSDSLVERTVSGDEAARRWQEAIASISDLDESPAYGGLVIDPQIGLVPVGRDPDSHLWEFAHLQTGEIPERDNHGRLVLTDETGLVFVLLPGSTFAMGAQSTDPDGANYDPSALADREGPVHRVTLSPFLLSKYEMTQGQWLRTTGSNPSALGPHVWNPKWIRSKAMADLTHPVESVSWFACMQVCRRIGCVLPSEARWEYGARAGTTTIWWTGNDLASLQGAANVADAYAGSEGAQWPAFEESLDDGYCYHAPVDEMRANPFGLLNVYGNLIEWCMDEFTLDFYRTSLLEPVDPVALSPRPFSSVTRGGGLWWKAEYTRSANRGAMPPSEAYFWLGLRPACDIRGETR